MKKIFNYIGLLLIAGLFACKAPVILEMTEIQKKDNNCEFTIETETYYEDMDSFKSNLEKEVYKNSKKCKCDTVYIDIKDLGNMRDKVKNVIWGVCKSEKLAKKMAKKK